MCSKRPFGSAKAARGAFKRSGFRIGTYFCDSCASYHVTSIEKRFSGPRAYEEPASFTENLESSLGRRPEFVMSVQAQQEIVDRAYSEAARRRGV